MLIVIDLRKLTERINMKLKKKHNPGGSFLFIQISDQNYYQDHLDHQMDWNSY